MSLVCLDTHILIWGIKEEATEGQEEMIARAKAFLEHLEKTDRRVLIPAVVVAEFLLRLPVEVHHTIVNLFQRAFFTAPFDLQAAERFARIWQAQRDTGRIQELSQSHGATKSELKADCMIVATAVARGTSCIYSNDDTLQKFAEGYIDVHEMPDILTQLDLFEDQSGLGSNEEAL